MALGATVPAVVGHGVQQAFRYAAIGIAAGSVLALGVSKLFASVLFIVDTFDPAGYAFGAAVVLAACLLAAWAPSRRAARGDPLDALRHEERDGHPPPGSSPCAEDTGPEPRALARCGPHAGGPYSRGHRG